MLTVVRGGREFTVEDTDVTSSWGFWQHWQNGSWEDWTLAAIDRLLPLNGHFLDIGAWVGPVTLWAARRALVTAIEPDPVAFDLLERNVQQNFPRRVRLIRAVASDRFGTATLHATAWGTSASSQLGSGESIEVASVDVREMLHDVDLVKMDIEGGEAILMPTLGPALRKAGIPLILSYHDWMYTPEVLPAFLAEMENWQKEEIAKATYICR